MPTAPKAVALYARISSDVDGLGLGTERQLEDCRRLAGSLGWAVAQEYVDNDVSAYSGKRRPAYERMLDDLRDGLRDGVLCYHVDRLTRRPVELEHFVETVDAAGVRHVKFVSGDMDLGTGDGLLIGRIMAAVAASESAAKSRRVKRKLDQVAAEGRPHGGFRRPYGFEDDKVTVRPDEAAIIRQVAERFCAGESLRAICGWLDEQGIRTVAGGPWRTPTLRDMLKGGRIAGLRTHRGEIAGPAIWPAIIEPAQRESILARMADQAASGRRSPRRYLLSGLLRCGRCGNTLYSSPKTTRRYVCLSGPDHGGCGRLTVVAEPLELLMSEAALERLDSPQLAATLAGRISERSDTAGLADALAADQALLEDLAAMLGKGELSQREWRAAREPVERRLQDRKRQLAAATRTDALLGLPGQAAQLREQWAGLSLSRQAAILKALLDHVVIHPGTAGARSLDLDRVRPVWRT